MTKVANFKLSDLFALLGDLHLGTKHDDEWTEQNILDSIKWFTTDCKSKGIKYCLQAGDWFDVRKGISQRTMEFMREEIAPLFQDTFDMTYVIVGNHDMHYKHEITPNSCYEVLSQFDKFHVIQEPETIDIDGVKIDMIPWICKSNSEQIFDFIMQSDSPYCMGHFELNGYYFYKGMKSSGIEPDFLEKYKNVWSGHFHTISNGGNVQYLGTPYTLTLGDANDPRGYWVYNTDAADIKFNQNPVTYHHRIYFDADTWKFSANDLMNLFGNKTVKLVIEKSHSEIKKKVNVDQILDDLERICFELKHEYKEELAGDDSTDQDDEIKNTFDIIKEQIELLEETKEVKDRVLKIFNGLYTEVMGS